ncbi:Acetyltransferase (GNAT) family protein [Desulfatibacillum alkenivorans DSM 16219]|jgi:ribosomal protein S18 acetylase RimI-like enzyme|uniref:Acetyltransferase (GNAT) family protein n=1 Tax=Desulfatibacillum alkenivorans DSM 16219 TaxID=1121393 RepID=A0A1M6G9Q4_9BACT|nr:GNAT family N-acetyltransferase [Desulfatibacillum alkenivorans]SHJ06700.1 Acetyltransferase (GNAT) family protein [Desulfatibacillum alkenivorans DSM 16219]
MELVLATEKHVASYGEQILDLIHSTGQAAFGYQFVSRAYFDLIVGASLASPGTLFGYDKITLAMDGGRLLGMEAGFAGPEFHLRKKAMASIFPELIESGALPEDAVSEMGKRGYQCSYLNPSIPKNVYYVLTLAVDERNRGKKIGSGLLCSAMDKAKAAGYRGLHLDVFADNPAVDFYKYIGLACLVETLAPAPSHNGVPKGLRMAMDF